MPVAQAETFLKQFQHLAGKPRGGAGCLLHEFAAAPQQMGQALLMSRLEKLVVGRPAIVNQDARVVIAQQALGHAAVAMAVNGVYRLGGRDEAVQPTAAAADAPARLIRHDPRGGGQRLRELVIDSRAASPRAQDAVGRAAARQANAEERLHDADQFAVRQPGLFVEFDEGGLGVGPQLRGGGSQRVGGLQRVAALDTPLTLPTPAEVHVELPINRLAGNFDLELRLDVGLVDGAAAIGAGVGQRGFVGFVDLLRRRRRSMRLGAVILARFTTGLLGFALGRPLGKRRGLPLAGAKGLVQEARQPLDLLAQPRHFRLETPTARAVRFSHAASLAKTDARSCASSPKRSPAGHDGWERALNNYRRNYEPRLIEKLR